MVFRHELGSYGAMMATRYLGSNGAPRSTPTEVDVPGGGGRAFCSPWGVGAAPVTAQRGLLHRALMQFGPDLAHRKLVIGFPPHGRRDKKAVSGLVQGA